MDTNTIIATASVFIAGCALVATIVQGRQNRKHSRLSVKPFLEILRHNNVRNGIRYYEIILINHGTGSAIIKNFDLLFEGKSVSLNDGKTYTAFLLEKMAGFKEKKITHRTKGSIIKTAEELILWKIECGQNQVIYDIKKLGLRIEYQSVYQDETFIFDSRERQSFFDPDSQ